MRRRWLAEVLFARRSVPREVAAFAARQLLTMPEPLRTSLTIAPGRVTFGEITRQSAGAWLEICDTAPAARLPLLMLAPIAVTYEYAMTEGLGRATWRTDHTYSPCPRAEAGRYLAFLASLGHQLAPIEQAVADGIPYTGDNPDDQLTAQDNEDADSPEPGSAGLEDEDAAGRAEIGTEDAMPGGTAAEEAEPEAAGTGDVGDGPSRATA